ncbi:MAG: DUF2207 domain-containing protein, partial [Candidatus Doudnabacteria bacterium]|nr:DUF2207 domain-containing protein [Candidatus Doudnabacteria bacterium]
MRNWLVGRSLLTAAMAVVFVVLAVPTEASATERIRAFVVDLEVHEDTSVTVVEQITYDFGPTGEHHGIIREIPLLYGTDDNQVTLDLTVQSVTDENGVPRPYTDTGYGYRQLKIGDPDVEVLNEHTYVITYVVDRAITGFDDYDELFWNVTGTGWSVPIDTAVARVTLPEAANEATNSATCFTGALFSKEKECTAVVLDDRTALFEATGLSAYEG